MKKRTISPKRVRCLIYSLMFFLGFCARKTPNTGLKREPEFIFLEVKGIKIKAEVARSEEARTTGLKYRSSLPEDQGMLFVFEEEGIHPFWMEDTKIPLDIAFIDKEKKIIDIQRMEPFSPQLHYPPLPFLYALEVNQGFFQRNGIGIGDTLKIPEREVR